MRTPGGELQARGDRGGIAEPHQRIGDRHVLGARHPPCLRVGVARPVAHRHEHVLHRPQRFDPRRFRRAREAADPVRLHEFAPVLTNKSPNFTFHFLDFSSQIAYSFPVLIGGVVGKLHLESVRNDSFQPKGGGQRVCDAFCQATAHPAVKRFPSAERRWVGRGWRLRVDADGGRCRVRRFPSGPQAVPAPAGYQARAVGARWFSPRSALRLIKTRSTRLSRVRTTWFGRRRYSLVFRCSFTTKGNDPATPLRAGNRRRRWPRPGLRPPPIRGSGRTGPASAQGLPKVAIRSTRHSNSTRFSSMAGSRSP